MAIMGMNRVLPVYASVKDAMPLQLNLTSRHDSRRRYRR